MNMHTATAWWTQATYNRLVAIVLLMLIMVTLVATPAGHGGAALAYEGLALLLLILLLGRSPWKLSPLRVRRMIAARPWFGHGLGQYVIQQRAYTHQGLPLSAATPGASLGELAHNFYLQTTAELGLVGLLLFAGILITFWWTGLHRVLRMSGTIRRRLLLGSLASTVAFAVDAIGRVRPVTIYDPRRKRRTRCRRLRSEWTRPNFVQLTYDQTGPYDGTAGLRLSRCVPRVWAGS